ncbi:MAG TPA: hypothetical protein VGG10_00830 [Rhizomicrobium sp.]|jgi:hypothetical protein
MTNAPHIETHDSTKPVLSTTEARQGTRTGVVTVLLVSLVLVVAAFAVIYFW